MRWEYVTFNKTKAALSCFAHRLYLKEGWLLLRIKVAYQYLYVIQYPFEKRTTEETLLIECLTCLAQ